MKILQAGGNICALDHDSLTPLDHLMLDRPISKPFKPPDIDAIFSNKEILPNTELPSLMYDAYVWGNNTNYNLGQVIYYILK